MLKNGNGVDMAKKMERLLRRILASRRKETGIGVEIDECEELLESGKDDPTIGMFAVIP